MAPVKRYFYLVLFTCICSSYFSLAQDSANQYMGACSAMPLPEIHEDSLLASGVGEKNALWTVGQTIRIQFLDGSNFLRQKVVQYVRLWEQHANLKFQFVQNSTADIRITFARKGVFQSQIGTYARHIPKNQPTMLLGFFENSPESEFRRLILHEFGHALGLHHEQLHPQNNIQWNRPAVYRWFLANLGWSSEQVDFNIFDKLPIAGIHFCDYDPRSIMHYFVLPEFTTNNFSVGDNTTLSNGDKNFISNLYPKGNRTNPICVDPIKEFRLTTRVQGQGSITVSPAKGNNANCTKTCTAIYEEGQMVQLTAVPPARYQFVRWSGGDCSNNTALTCTVNMNSNKVITAVFEEEVSRNLTVEVEDNGSVDVIVNNEVVHNCSNNCAYTAEEPVNLTLMAKPDTGYRFVRWEGNACNDQSQTSCPIALNGTMNMKAIFELDQSEEPCIDFSTTITKTTCDKGNLSVKIEQGVAPYTIQVEGPITGVASVSTTSFRIEDFVAGLYTITIEDAEGCKETKSVAVQSNCRIIDSTTSGTSTIRGIQLSMNHSTNSSMLPASKTTSTTRSRVNDRLAVIEVTAKDNILKATSNYPNPFQEQTSLPFTLSRNSTVNLEIFTGNGQQVYHYTQAFEVGSHQIVIGPEIVQKTGLYIYHLRVDGEIISGKMIRF